MQVLAGCAIANEQWLQWGAVIGASLIAAVADAKRGRIPNVITLPVWLAGLAWAIFSDGVAGFRTAIGVSLLLAFPYVILFLIAHGGAGDAKLMGAIGAWLPFREGVVVLCCVAVTGMVLALLRVVASVKRKNLLLNTVASLYVMLVTCCAGWPGWKALASAETVGPEKSAGQISLPYGVAIFLGVCSAAVGVRLWLR